MNRLLFLLPAAALAACQSPAPATGRPSETTGNLIIGYDPAVGIEPLLAAASDYRAEILYRYTIINAVAVKPPANIDPQQAVRHFKTVRGVLSVEPDRIMQLHAQQ
ncbi:hypothetical protein [Neisseria elongata]